MAKRISLSAVRPAKPFQSQGYANPLMTLAQTLQSNMCAPSTASAPSGSFGKMSQEFSPQRETRLGTFWVEYVATLPKSLLLLADGKSAGFCLPQTRAGIPLRGACWTPNTSDSPSNGGGCSLSAILETWNGGAPAKYCLSAQAKSSLLRRNAARELPPELLAKLRE